MMNEMQSAYFILPQVIRRRIKHMQWVHALGRLVVPALVSISCAAAGSDVERTGGPYVPTPQAVVDAMLDLARVGARDYVIDLGSGDGRIVLTAAQRFSAQGMGYDIDPELVQQSNAEAQRRGLADRASFREQDVLQARVEDATVLTMYLLPGMMHTLQAKLVRELKPGTRIVSHDFSFSDWKPDREVSVDVAEKYGSAGRWKSTLFYWVVPARISGAWRISAPACAPQPFALALEQQYQYFEGAATIRGRSVAVTGGRIEGERVRFRIAAPAGTCEFNGLIDGDRLRGEIVLGARAAAWTAEKGSSASLSH